MCCSQIGCPGPPRLAPKGEARRPQHGQRARPSSTAPQKNMSQTHRDLLLMCAAQDHTFKYSGGQRGTWVGKCIHCRRKIGLDADGTPHGGTSLEHIVPRTHGGMNALDNLALACTRCNGQKGRKVDVLPWNHSRLQSMIQQLRDERQKRLRPMAHSDCPRLRLLLAHQCQTSTNGPDSKGT